LIFSIFNHNNGLFFFSFFAYLIKDMYAALVDDGSTDTTTSCSKIASMPIDKSLQCSSMELENQELEDMNQEAQSEYHNANAYVANSQDDCQNINNSEANLKEAACSHDEVTVVEIICSSGLFYVVR
jgi:hypothetical protein